MSTSYVINFTDPLRASFSIAPGGFNGPGGSVSSSSLRLYGRGALEWGEAVDEDLLRLNENFAGATPPIAPVGGQLWNRQRLYCMVGAAPTNSSEAGGKFFRWNFNPANPSLPWDDNNHVPSNGFDVDVHVGSINTYPSGSAPGRYVFATTEGKLYRWDKAYQQADYSWLERVMMGANGNPNTLSLKPEEKLLVWNAFTTTWMVPSVVTISPSQPTNAEPGTIWFNSATNTLNVFGSATTAYPVIMGNNPATSTNLNMGGHSITNVGNPVNPTDAATMGYVDNAVNVTYLTTTLDPRYVNVSGDTMSGYLTLNANPTANFHAATKQYVDVAVAGGVAAGTGSFATVYTSGTPTYKAGDIYVTGSAIWMASAAGTGAPGSGNWKQVWPPVYQ